MSFLIERLAEPLVPTRAPELNERLASVGQRISDNVPPGGQQAIEELSGRVMSHGHAVLNYTSVVNGVAYDRQAVWTREGDRIEVVCYDLTATVRVASVQNAVIKHEPRVLAIPTQDTK